MHTVEISRADRRSEGRDRSLRWMGNPKNRWAPTFHSQNSKLPQWGEEKNRGWRWKSGVRVLADRCRVYIENAFYRKFRRKVGSSDEAIKNLPRAFLWRKHGTSDGWGRNFRPTIGSSDGTFLGGRRYFYGSYQSIGNSDGRVNPGREYFVGIHMGFPTSVGSSDQGSEVPTLWKSAQ